jgi:hypothetical protein
VFKYEKGCIIAKLLLKGCFSNLKFKHSEIKCFHCFAFLSTREAANSILKAKK